MVRNGATGAREPSEPVEYSGASEWVSQTVPI